MNGRKPRRALARTVTGALLATALLTVPASAVAPSETGWWWRAQSGLLVEMPPPPQVPDGGLYVEGAPDGPNAVAALRFTLPPGTAPAALTLHVADERGGEDAELRLCPAAGSWLSADAGRWQNRPVAECPGLPWSGTRAADGSSWTFDLRALPPRDGRIDVVLLPGTVEGRPAQAGGSVFALAFDAPGTGSLTTTSQGEATPPAIPPPTRPPATPPPTFDEREPASPPPVGVAEPAEPAEPAVQDPSVLTPNVTGRGRGTPAAAPVDDGDARALATLVALLSVGVAGVLSRDRAATLPEAPRGRAREGGIGRFRRPRNSPPPPL